MASAAFDHVTHRARSCHDLPIGKAQPLTVQLMRWIAVAHCDHGNRGPHGDNIAQPEELLRGWQFDLDSAPYCVRADGKGRPIQEAGGTGKIGSDPGQLDVSRNFNRYLGVRLPEVDLLHYAFNPHGPSQVIAPSKAMVGGYVSAHCRQA
jgi:hypothetical protein